ncbi:uncharacterized protein LOC108915442 [Anoplophora glabripennis]|uniref:uncharacterized protein LOC108915442 n=1 Tax=Anoplophora glabripennis TaxID=217634 RepID=UPI00087587D3|nr:uncharacterized protein LOC108915442 [Anoplophora glabripennis]
MLITNKFNGIEEKAVGNNLWKSIAIKLNSLGYGEKTINEWRRAVTDWKSKVKSKASRIRNSLLQTGGGSFDAPQLTPLEEKLLSLMGTKCIAGDVGVQELGQNIKSHSQASTPQIVHEIEVVDTSSQMDKSSEEVMDDEITNIDHDYSINNGKRCNNNDHATKMKRQKITSIPRISKNLVEMTSQSLKILESIDTNISRIANSFQDLIDILGAKAL